MEGLLISSRIEARQRHQGMVERRSGLSCSDSSLSGQDRHARKEWPGYGSWVHLGKPSCHEYLQDEDQGQQGHEAAPPDVLPWSLWAERVHHLNGCRREGPRSEEHTSELQSLRH